MKPITSYWSGNLGGHDIEQTLKNDERLVEIGQTAMRAPNGSFLPTIPKYIIVKAADVLPESNVSKGEVKLIADIGGLFAEKFAQYVKGT